MSKLGDELALREHSLGKGEVPAASSSRMHLTLHRAKLRRSPRLSPRRVPHGKFLYRLR
jgi:hypothetical protein